MGDGGEASGGRERAAGGNGGLGGAGAANEGGAGGDDGEGGAAGSGGASTCEACECIPGAERSCRDGGFRGTCADGVQVCGDDGRWGACSVEPAPSDTCDPGNDDTCDGVSNEGCPCVAGDERPCAQGGYVGPCAEGTQRCTEAGEWGPCSILPAAEDTCELGNNDDCHGPPNEGCLCIENETERDCGPCPGGKQVCTDGKIGSFGPCTGPMPVTYFRDADEDGFGDPGAPFSTCGAAPPGFVTNSSDCDDDNDKAYPGQTAFFTVPRANGSFDYNCNGKIDYEIPLGTRIGPLSCNGTCGGCDEVGDKLLDASVPCGGAISRTFCVCMGICTTFGSSGGTQACH